MPDPNIQRIENIIAATKADIAQAGILATVTGQQAADYINANVSNIATAKAVLILMARLLIAMRNYLLRDLDR